MLDCLSTLTLTRQEEIDSPSPIDSGHDSDTDCDVDLFNCDDLAAALAACAPPHPGPKDPLPGAVLKTFRAGIDGALLLEHAVPHRVVPQLLRPVVGPYVDPQRIKLRRSADAAMCVDTIKAADDMFLLLASYARHLPHVTSVIDTAHCEFDLRAFIPAEMHASLQELVVAQSSHVSTRSIRRLITFKQLTSLDVSHCASLRPTALPYIAQLTNLEFLNLEGLQKGRREGRAITIPEDFANLTHLRVLKLGWHRLSSLAPLQHLSSLEELTMPSMSYPRESLRHLAGLQHLHTLKIQGGDPCLIGIRRLEHLTTLSLRHRQRMTPTEMEELGSTRGLTSLVLARVDRGWGFDFVVQRLRSMPTLTSLHAENATSASFAGLVEALPRLKHLNIKNGPGQTEVITLHQYTSLERLTLVSQCVSSMIPDLAGLRQLQHLDLATLTVIDAATLRPLTACSRLTELYLFGSAWKMDCFDVLSELRILEVLHMSLGRETPFSDEVARHFGSMPRLREIHLGTSARVAELYRRSLPWIAVH